MKSSRSIVVWKPVLIFVSLLVERLLLLQPPDRGGLYIQRVTMRRCRRPPTHTHTPSHGDAVTLFAHTGVCPFVPSSNPCGDGFRGTMEFCRFLYMSPPSPVLNYRGPRLDVTVHVIDWFRTDDLHGAGSDAATMTSFSPGPSSSMCANAATSCAKSRDL